MTMEPPSLPGTGEQPYKAPVIDLSLSHVIKSALQEAGYYTTTDILFTSANDLSAELNISSSQAEDILRQCRNPPGPSRPSSPTSRPNGASRQVAPDIHDPSQAIQASSAADLLSPAYLPRFSTLSQTLDALIARRTYAEEETLNGDRSMPGTGAITPGMAVEISGPPGIGKTSIAVGLALSARMDRRRRRRNSLSRAEDVGEVLIVDTEGSISVNRLQTAAEAITRTSDITATSILEGIHLVRVATQVQMIAFLNLLDDWLREHPRVNMIIIDSLSYHFRQPNLEISARRHIMETIKQQIGKASTVHHCAVILVTQMGTKSLSAEGKRVDFGSGEKVVLMPQLGGQWQTARTLNITLFRGPDRNEVRYAHVGTNADSDPNGEWACFDISSDGLPMDVEDIPA